MTRFTGVLLLVIGLALVALSVILFAGSSIDESIASFVLGIIIAVIGFSLIKKYDLLEEKPTR